MNEIKKNNYGFNNNRSGTHTSRTMMLDEIRILLSYVNDNEAEKSEYQRVIEHENCLSKRSGKTRNLTFRHLVELYALDPTVPLYQVMHYFWNRDTNSQPLIALLCAYARDPILRMSAPLILDTPQGSTITRVAMEEYIDKLEPGRFSNATLKSTAQNINSTWTKSGHLNGRIHKIRSKPIPSAGSVSYALFLGYISGYRGESLFQTDFSKLLDSSFEQMSALAENASRKGWIVFKRVGDVIEVLFPNFINNNVKG